MAFCHCHCSNTLNTQLSANNCLKLQDTALHTNDLFNTRTILIRLSVKHCVRHREHQFHSMECDLRPVMLHTNYRVLYQLENINQIIKRFAGKCLYLIRHRLSMAINSLILFQTYFTNYAHIYWRIISLIRWLVQYENYILIKK